VNYGALRTAANHVQLPMAIARHGKQAAVVNGSGFLPRKKPHA
jgi:hypothetical protein